ncbi:MAG: AmmeMemoRadiSam system radical SAM enzyme [Candidatus Pacearchaeota archaeon]
MYFKEAQYYRKLADKKVHCLLCPHQCIIGNGETGKCDVRMNIDGNLKSLNYGKPHKISYQKIETIPMFHFMPGNEILQVGAVGNNLSEKWLEGEQIKKNTHKLPTLKQTPSQIIRQAKKMNVNIISYSHNEPVVYYEYLSDIINNSPKRKHIISTNGFIEEDPLLTIAPKINAAIIDIKSMNNEFYEHFLGGKLEPVLKSAKLLFNHNKWIEIKITLIPRIHNDFYDIRKLVSWILQNLGPDVPLHFIAFKPNNDMQNLHVINGNLLKKARKISMDAGMNFVYTHGIEFQEGLTTFCPNCRKPVIIRNDKLNINLKEGKCVCGKEIPGIWK